MRVVIADQLWIGHSRDLEDPAQFPDLDEMVVVDLAIDEPPRPMFRDRISLRIPLIDGAGNSPERLKLAVNTVASLVCDGVPTLIACSSGMSRSPAIAAFAIATAHKSRPAEGLSIVTESGGCDIAAALWNELSNLFAADHVR